MWHQTGHEEQWLKTERQRMDQMTQRATAGQDGAAPAQSHLGRVFLAEVERARLLLDDRFRRPALARFWSLF